MSQILSALKRLSEQSPSATAAAANDSRRPGTPISPASSHPGQGAAADTVAPASAIDVAQDVAQRLDMVQALATQLAEPRPMAETASAPIVAPRTHLAPGSPAAPTSTTPVASSATEWKPSKLTSFAVLSERRGTERRNRERSSPPPAPPHIAQLRDNILADLPRGHAHALLFVRPGLIGDATTTTVAELAVALADETQQDVLAVDANMVRGETTDVHDVGLADVLAGRVSWQSAVASTRNPHVLLLGAGVDPPTVLDAAPLESLLESWKAIFPLVLIDGGDIAADLSQTLTGKCDATYLFAQLGITPRRALRRALAAVRAANGRPAGCIAVGDL